MKALIYKDTKTVEVQERAMPVCGPDDVIVRNVRAGFSCLLLSPLRMRF